MLTGGMKGGLTGEMKMARSLYLKGLTLCDGRDERNYELGVKNYVISQKTKVIH